MALQNLFEEGTHDFHYVSMIYDLCMPAKDRLDEYSIYWVPIVYFDGGFGIEIGSYNLAYTTSLYEGHIDACGARTVADIDVDVRVRWIGNAAMDVFVTVKNNEATEYKGTIRAFVTELVSSMGWKDYHGNLYTHPFLDFAFNEALAIPAGGTWEKSEVWDGNLHGDGFGHTYGSITYDNIMVVAGVYDDLWHQGYSDPPSGCPFDAYYIDEAAGARPDTLVADAETLSAAGGSVRLDLYAGRDEASRRYLVLGSATGTSPGTPLPGGLAVLPLNWDPFTDLVLAWLNTALFKDFLGTIDQDGLGSAQLAAPPLPPAAVGVVMTYAYCLNNPYDRVSNPVEVEIVP
jgi:hypothetical protein